MRVPITSHARCHDHCSLALDLRQLRCGERDQVVVISGAHDVVDDGNRRVDIGCGDRERVPVITGDGRRTA